MDVGRRSQTVRLKTKAKYCLACLLSCTTICNYCINSKSNYPLPEVGRDFLTSFTLSQRSSETPWVLEERSREQSIRRRDDEQRQMVERQCRQQYHHARQAAARRPHRTTTLVPHWFEGAVRQYQATPHCMRNQCLHRIYNNTSDHAFMELQSRHFRQYGQRRQSSAVRRMIIRNV